MRKRKNSINFYCKFLNFKIFQLILVLIFLNKFIIAEKFYQILINSPQLSLPGKIGYPCNRNPTDQPCIVVNSICLRGYCECLPMYYPNGINECLLINNGNQYIIDYWKILDITIGKSCINHLECRAPEEHCNEKKGVCECLSNFVNIGSKCLPGKKFNF